MAENNNSGESAKKKNATVKTRSQLKEKKDRLNKLEEDLKTLKKLKKTIKGEIIRGESRVEGKDEKRVDALVGVAIRWSSYINSDSQHRLMKTLDEFYFDDSARSFLGFELLSEEEKKKREEAREKERERRIKESGEKTFHVRIRKAENSKNSTEAS